MKITLVALCVVLFGTLLSGAAASTSWETDYEAALEKAKKENRFLLVDFSGSDWCGWCIRLQKEVFSERDFKEYAEQALVCVLIDSPRRKELPADLQAQNTRLKQQFQVRGFPTVLILNPDGEPVGRTGYRKGGPEEYVTHLKAFIDLHRKDYPMQDAAPAPRQATSARRTWTASSGTTLEAELVEVGGGWVRLRKEDGSQIKIRARNLSEADRAFLGGI